MLQIAANGFPVWMMNQRGTDYSRKHTVFAVESEEYWDLSLTDLWKDIEGNIDIIKTYLGYDNSYYVGYAGATSQMLYALATQEPYLKEHL